jgi:hypothetical protein
VEEISTCLRLLTTLSAICARSGCGLCTRLIPQISLLMGSRSIPADAAKLLEHKSFFLPFPKKERRFIPGMNATGLSRSDFCNSM